MRTSAWLPVLSLLSILCSAIPLARQDEPIEEDGSCEMVWVIVYESPEEYQEHHHNEGHGKHEPTETSSPFAPPPLSIPIPFGSSGEKGRLPPPTATGSAFGGSFAFHPTSSFALELTTAVATSPSTTAPEEATTAQPSSSTVNESTQPSVSPTLSTPEISETTATTTSSAGVASSSTPASNGKYPFTALVAFGDNLSDNGNGSVAHHGTYFQH